MAAIVKGQASEINDLFDGLRDGFIFVAERAQHVKIRYDRLAAYSAALPAAAPVNVLDPDHHFTGGLEETAAYIFMLDALNFGSGYAPLMAAEGWRMLDHSIYFTLSTRLKYFFEQNGPATAAQMAAMTAKDVKAILQLPEGRYSGEFAAMAADSVAALGRAVTAQFNGSFRSLLAAADGSAAWLVSWLTTLEHFNDVHDYCGYRIAFYKRAQITAADLHLAFWRKGESLFSDIGSLTMFPDNGVPHVLYCDGILEYSDGLVAKIAAGTEIRSGSDEEIEIRACAAHAVELIAREKGLMAMNIDHILWHRSVESPKYVNSLSHRTLSRFY